MQKIVLRGRGVVKGRAEGEALVTKARIGFFGSVDPRTGVIVEEEHEIEGQNITGKVLVFPGGKGSTGGSFVLYQLATCGIGPKAIVNLETEPIIAVGAILADIPVVDKPNQDPLAVIKTGDYVIVDGNDGRVVVIKK